MKKSKKLPKSVFGDIIIYNDENIYYYQGSLISIDMDMNYLDYNSLDGTCGCIRDGMIMTAKIDNYKEGENIVLDDTTMKRIAKYNKTADLKRLDKIIAEKEEKIRELDALLTDKEKRWKKVKDFVANIYDININEDDDDYIDYD